MEKEKIHTRLLLKLSLESGDWFSYLNMEVEAAISH